MYGCIDALNYGDGFIGSGGKSGLVWRNIERPLDPGRLVIIVVLEQYKHSHPNFDSFDFVSVAVLECLLGGTHPFSYGRPFSHQTVRTNADFWMRTWSILPPSGNILVRIGSTTGVSFFQIPQGKCYDIVWQKNLHNAVLIGYLGH